MNILEIMKGRHSVRSFDGNPLSDADKYSFEKAMNVPKDMERSGHI